MTTGTMKSKTPIPHALLLATVALLPTTTPSWARPPQSISGRATVIAVDGTTHSLVLKLAKDKKPVVMDWNKETEFTKGGQALDPALLRSGDTVAILYRTPFFGNLWLRKVSAEDANSREQNPR